MRTVLYPFGAFLAATSFFCISPLLHGDEPSKPTAPASETNPAVPAPGHSVHGEAFNDGPRHTAHIMPGMGKSHFPATTKKPEAQAFIDQGVAQLHSFYYFESERSFRQAAKLDPDCATAYWGMAMSNVNNSKRAKEFLKEARKRVASASRREQYDATARMSASTANSEGCNCKGPTLNQRAAPCALLPTAKTPNRATTISQ